MYFINQEIFSRSGGVLLMGYELYRQLANRRHRRKRQKAHDQFDQEEDNQSKHILEGKQSDPFQGRIFLLPGF
jgi:hypothetical protein